MTYIATAPVPAHSRLWNAGTYEFPDLSALSVTDAAELLDVDALTAFSHGARIREEDDVTAVAGTMPPLTPERVDALEHWCAEVSRMHLPQIADLWNVSLATAEYVREILAGGAR